MTWMDEGGFDEYGDYIGYQNWEIGQRIELGDKVGMLIGHCCEGSNATVRWEDGTEKTYWAGKVDGEFSKLIFKW